MRECVMAQSMTMIALHVRPTVLWHESETHCVCSCVASEWTLRLFVDDIVVRERIVEGVRPMLRIAQEWRETVSNAHDVAAQSESRSRFDRRLTAPERRNVPRGGRRANDASRKAGAAQSERDGSPAGTRTETEAHHGDLTALKAELERLREENAILRDSALAFGALAERLNTAVRQHGGSGDDRSASRSRMS